MKDIFVMVFISIALAAGFITSSYKLVNLREDYSVVSRTLEEAHAEADRTYQANAKHISSLEVEIDRLLKDMSKMASLQSVSFFDIDTVNIAEKYNVSNPFHHEFKVTSRFGESTGFGYRRKHLGTDLSVYGYDMSVYPMWDGVVADIGISDIYGKWVLIQHDDVVYTKYCHLDKIFYTALPGEQVTTDTRIGLEGNTGRSTARHLHLEMRIDIEGELKPIDIYPWLREAE